MLLKFTNPEGMYFLLRPFGNPSTKIQFWNNLFNVSDYVLESMAVLVKYGNWTKLIYDKITGHKSIGKVDME